MNISGSSANEVDKKVKIISPAKINLFLNVLKKRDDGYHEVETVLQAIELYDEISLMEIGRGVEVICLEGEAPSGKANLAYQAATVILKNHKIKSGVRIEIKKRIPIAAGLGGGSSNAAATFMGLNKLWKLNLSRTRLIELAASVGMDVPFFISGGRAIGTGRGDEITPLADWQHFWLVLLLPKFSILTHNAYQNLDLTNEKSRLKTVLSHLKDENLKKALYNRFEEVTTKEYPVIRIMKDKLVSLGAEGALMSGSGPAVFGIVRQRAQAEKIAMAVQEEVVYVVKTSLEGVKVIN
jgi:4-diphosphocytidyl-2-C-methyl-D-erythritol kinase